MAYKHNCGCGGSINKPCGEPCEKPCDGACGDPCGGPSHGPGMYPPNIIDINCVRAIPWDSTDTLLGIDRCKRVIAVEKPLYELSETDRDKLDALIIDGGGDLFLSDDGVYKRVNSIEAIDLVYDANPANFVILNQTKLAVIKELLLAGKETFVRLNLSGYSIPLSVSYTNSNLILSFDQTVLNPLLGRAAEPTYDRITVLIVLNTVTEPYTIIEYIFKSIKAFDLVTDGEGNKALYDNGEYKETLTSDQTETLINLITDSKLDDYYDKQEVDDLLTERIENAVIYDAANDINAKRHIILGNSNSLLGTTLQGQTVNIGQVSQYTDNNHPIVDIGSTTSHLTLNSYDRVNVQLSGEAGNHLHEVAYVADVDEVNNNLADALAIERSERIAGDNDLQTQVTQNKAELDGFQTTVNQSFVTVNEALTDANNRIDVVDNKVNINTTDITGILDTLANLEKFRGYFETTSEITSLPDPTNGDYAWNAETGTVWTYNGVTWADSGTAIPDQTVQASDLIPLVDSGTGNAGSSNEYARGDHRHPEDTNKANVSDLDNYLPIIGNTQTTPMTGDIWLGTNNKVYLSDSGNSSLGYDTEDTGALALIGNGSNGIDLRSDLGTIKANGQRIITNGQNAAVQISSDVIQLNATGTRAAAYSMNGGIITESAERYIANIGTGGDGGYNVNLTSGDAVINAATGKFYYGSNALPGNEVARIANIDNLQSQINDITPGFENYVKKTGDTLTGDLNFTEGANIVLGYSENTISTIRAVDEEGGMYNLVQLRTNVPTSTTPIDQVDVGDINTQYNGRTFYIPTIDINDSGVSFDEQYDYVLPSTKYRFVIDSWLKDHYLNGIQIANQYYNKDAVNTLIGTKADLSYLLTNYYDRQTIDEMISNVDLSNYYNKEESDERYILNGSNPGDVTINTTGKLYYNGLTANNEVATKGDIAAIDLSNFYDKDETDNLLADKADLSDLNNYLPVTGGVITGNNSIQFNSTANRIRYDSANANLEVYSTANGGINLRTPNGTVKANGVDIATVDDIVRYTAGEGININDDNVITALAQDLTIAESDQVLTMDAAGLKANLSSTLTGTVLNLIGKDNVIITSIDFGSIIAGIVSGTVNDGVITFELSNGNTIDVDVHDLITEYTASGYLTIDENQNITLNYNVLRDALVNDGFVDDLSDYSTTLQINNLLASKANISDVYTRTQTNTLLSNKANSDDVYTTDQVDNFLAGKANVDDVYSKTEVDNYLDEKADVDNVVTLTDNQTIPGVKTFGASTYLKAHTFIGAKTNTADGQVGAAITSTGNLYLQGTNPTINFYRGTDTESNVAIQNNAENQLFFNATTGALFNGPVRANGGLRWTAEAIPSDSNLDAYTTAGIYRCSTAAVGATIVNVPIPTAFSLIVLEDNNTCQIFIAYSPNDNSGGQVYKRHYYQNVWTPWRRMAFADETPQFGTFGTITSLGIGHTLNTGAWTTYDVRFVYTLGGTVTSQISFNGGFDGEEHILSIINNGTGNLTLPLPYNVENHQSDDEQIVIEPGRTAELSIRVIGNRYVVRTIGT